MIVVTCLFFSAVFSLNKRLHVSLQSSWPSTPLLAESVEFWGESGDPAFFRGARLLDAADIAADSPKNQHKRVSLLAKTQRRLLDMALGLRIYAPRVAAAREMLRMSVSPHVRAACAGSIVQRGESAACFGDHQGILAETQVQKEWTALGAGVMDGERILARGVEGGPRVIAWMRVGDGRVSALLAALETWADQTDGTVVVRQRTNDVDVDNGTALDRFTLGGFGVELSLKSVEYRADDDADVKKAAASERGHDQEQDEELLGLRFGVLRSRYPDEQETLGQLQEYLHSRDTGFEELRVWEMQLLGVHAAQRVASADRPLSLLRELASEFPTYATALTRLKTNDTFVQELERVQQFVQEGHANHLLLNGRLIDPRNVDAFELYGIVAAELNRVDVTKSLQLSALDGARISALDVSRSAGARFAVPIEGRALILTDIEKDIQYSRWSSSLSQLVDFEPSWMAQFPQVRRNVFNAVFAVDPTRKQGMMIMSLFQRVAQQGLPLRMALFLALPDEHADNTEEEKVLLATVRVYLALAGTIGDTDPSTEAVEAGTWPNRMALMQSLAIFNGVAQAARQYVDITSIAQLRDGVELVARGMDIDELMQGGDDDVRTHVDMVMARMRQATKDLGLGVAEMNPPLAFVNGKMVRGADLMQDVVREIASETVMLGELVQSKELDAKTDIYQQLQSAPGVLERFNARVLATKEHPLRIVSMADSAWGAYLDAAVFVRHPDHEFEPVLHTHIVSLDAGQRDDRTSLETLLDHVERSDASRVAVASCIDSLENRAVSYALSHCAGRTSKCLSDVRGVLALLNDGLLSAERLAAAVTKGSVGTAETALNTPVERLHACALFNGKDAATTINGRVLPLQGAWTRTSDWAHLEAHEWRYGALLTLLDTVELTGVSADDLTTRFKANLFLRVASLLGSDAGSGVRKIVLPEELPVHVSLGDEGCSLTVQAILDPLSVSAQRAAPMLEALADGFGACVRLTLNPVMKMDKLPLKTYYQYVLPVQPTFDEAGALEPIRAAFPHLPAERLLTLALDQPARWLAEPVEARYDLDNIRLALLPSDESTLHATFELRAIMVEGNCVDQSNNGEPPRGLQLVLDHASGTSQNAVDTLVMSNYGYFQLKAKPGLWSLDLVKGRSSDLYSIEGGRQMVLVDSFAGATVKLNVARRAGREEESLLGEADEAETAPASDEQQDMMDQIARMMGRDVPERKKDPAVEAKRREKRKAERERLAAKAETGTVHVFSVVTGHLYERLLRIMMLSVRRQTQNPVKFWLLSNFLSPHFRDLLPALAKEFDFEFELVTYNWPAWLVKQTVKQRIIWAYKVLFLDVLFPLDLERVIFVDADQVVRGDLKELMALDLEGAPYALTPFCDDKPEMDGYRFWKRGYWKDQLKGRPYHISALYIVDLAVFRRRAAGDVIRATYQGLVSSDPENSLANLDQDQLNVLQDQLPIYSLPQRVLWCETWCADETLGDALTIDLCNNPETKERKLDMARRLIPEWTTLDNELRAFVDRWEDETATPDQHADTPPTHLHSEL